MPAALSTNNIAIVSNAMRLKRRWPGVPGNGKANDDYLVTIRAG